MDSERYVEQLWERIGLIESLGLRLAEVSPSALTVFLPIVLNRNDKQTAFAGSLYSALVLSGWTLLSLKAAERALSPDIMIVESRCSYRHAIISDCLVDCVLEQDPFREYAGRSFFTGLECVARVEDLCCVEFYGKFYVKTVSAA